MAVVMETKVKRRKKTHIQTVILHVHYLGIVLKRTAEKHRRSQEYSFCSLLPQALN